MRASNAHPPAEFAPAKVNLTLRILGRRGDGYHELESLVVFADVGDHVSFTPGTDLDLVVEGPTATASGDPADNLVLRAAHALASRVQGMPLGRFRLDKRLPVAAGLGGGSSDAAAALRLLAGAHGLRLDDPRLLEAAVATGADVPVCLDPRPRVMRGIGEILSQPLNLSRLPAVLANPRVAVATADVFAALALALAERRAATIDCSDMPDGCEEFARFLAGHSNDLEPAAIKIAPPIADVLAALRATSGCLLARMSGSGATCFGLFASASASAAAARRLQAEHRGWWVRATTLG